MANDSKDLAIRIDTMLAQRLPRMDASLIGTGINPEKFRYMATSQLAKKDDKFRAVVAANPLSFVTTVCEAAEQALDFSKPNEAHLAVFRDHGVAKVVLIRGYKGIAKMARRSPNVDDVEAVAVYSKDTFKVIQGSDKKLIHEPPPLGEDGGEIIGFYAIAFLHAGPPKFQVMTTVGIEAHAHRFIRAESFGPFAGVKSNGRKDVNFEAYGLKTVLIRLCYRELDLNSELGLTIQSEFEAEPLEAVAGEKVEGIEAEFEDISDKVAARKAELKAVANGIKPIEPTKAQTLPAMGNGLTPADGKFDDLPGE